MTDGPVAGRAAWALLASRMLLVLGVAQLVAGVVFFFAFNWDDMTRWQKFAALEIGLVCCAIAARLRGLDDIVGQLLLVGAAVLGGVTLAVAGQVYQTGADLYELFGAWAAMIAVWVIGSRFAGMWVLWFLLVNVAVALFAGEFRRRWGLAGEDVLLILGALNGLFLIWREVSAARAAWAAPVWLRWLMFAAFIGTTGLAAVIAILGAGRSLDPEELAVLAVYALGAGAGYIWYVRVRDIVVAVLLALSVAGVACIAVGRLLDSAIVEAGDVAYYAVMTIVVLIVFGGAGLWVAAEGARRRRGGSSDA